MLGSYISKIPWWDNTKCFCYKSSWFIWCFINCWNKEWNIFGGYTKTGWDETKCNDVEDADCHSADKDAFVFYLHPPDGYESFISNVKQGEHQYIMLWVIMELNMECLVVYFMWMVTWIIIYNYLYLQYHEGGNYEKFKHDQRHLAGNVSHLRQIKYESDEWEIEVSNSIWINTLLLEL